MKLPKSVKIGPITYEVVERMRVANDSKWGQIEYTESVIELQPDMPEQHRTIVLWHEIFHGMLLHGGIREHDERILDVLSYGMVGVLADNPELVK